MALRRARVGTRMRILVGRGGVMRQLGPTTRPRITAINPNAGPSAGGTAITLTGINFTGATAVNFGSNAVGFTVVDDNQITVTSPPGSGAVFVTVTTSEGTSATVSASRFTYAGAP